MTTRNAFGFQSFSCGGNASAASSDARIHSLLDTAVNLVVSICVFVLFVLDIRVILPSA